MRSINLLATYKLGAGIYGLIPFLCFLGELDSFCLLNMWLNFKTVKVKLTYVGILFRAVGGALQFFLKRQWVSGLRFSVLYALVLKYLSYLASSQPNPNSQTYHVHSPLSTSAPATDSPFLQGSFPCCLHDGSSLSITSFGPC